MDMELQIIKNDCNNDVDTIDKTYKGANVESWLNNPDNSYDDVDYITIAQQREQ